MYGQRFSLLVLVILLAIGLPGFITRDAHLHSVQAQESGVSLPLAVPADWSTAAQENTRKAEYHVTWQDQTYLPDLPAAYQAPNRAHNLRTYFAPEGIRVIPRVLPDQGNGSVAWEWGLTLTGYGYAGAIQPLPAAELVPGGSRMEYHRGALTEWYVNDARGLEQGFTLTTPPQSAINNPQSEIVLTLALSGDLTPHMTEDGAIEFTTSGGVRVLRYGDLIAYDATDHNLPAHLSISDLQSQISIHVDTRSATFPITIDPLATTPNWTAESDQVGAWFGNSAGTAGDVNGDGYADVIVGAFNFDNGQIDEGRAFAYYGSAAGLSATPNWTAECDQAFAQFGRSVRTAGDVNGDGYADVIVGAPTFDNDQFDEGRAFVYHGAVEGLSATANWTAESNQVSAQFGNAVSTAGDVNGDGYADVIVGAYLYDNGQANEGGAFVYHGAAAGLSATPNWKAEGDQTNTNFGFSVGTAGDVNGDGYDDVIVGALAFDNGQTDEGRAFVYYGSAAGLSAAANWIAESDQALAVFGNSVSTAGDVNGDGYADVFVGALAFDNGQTDEGRVFVYHGSATGLSTTSNWTAESNQVSAQFGSSAGTAGDVNGDGINDIIIGAYFYDSGQTDEGRAFVYHGAAAGLSATPNWMAESDQDTAWFGVVVGTAGDVNGDGYADVIVGAVFYDNSQTDEGRAFVYHGAAEPPLSTPTPALTSTSAATATLTARPTRTRTPRPTRTPTPTLIAAQESALVPPSQEQAGNPLINIVIVTLFALGNLLFSKNGARER
jgi:hypothetical protein